MRVEKLIEELERCGVGKAKKERLKDNTYYIRFVDEYEESRVTLKPLNTTIEISTYPQSSSRLRTYRSNIRIVDESVDIYYIVGLILNKLGDTDDSRLVDLYFKLRDDKKNSKYYYIHDMIISELGSATTTKTYYERYIRTLDYDSDISGDIKLNLMYEYEDCGYLRVGLRFISRSGIVDKYRLWKFIVDFPIPIERTNECLEGEVWKWRISDTEAKTIDDLQQKLDTFINEEILPPLKRI